MKLRLKQFLLCSIVASVFLAPFIFASCREEAKSSVNFAYNPDSVPTIKTDSANILISDSGIIRYKAIAKTWEMFEQAKEKYWYFPDKIYLEQFDTTFNVVLTIQADTAWNFVSKNLWKLRGHVFMKNNKGETFASEEFYWDQNRQKVYSDSVVAINSPGQALIYAKSFIANQNMTEREFTDMGRLSPDKKTLIWFDENNENNKDSEDQEEE